MILFSASKHIRQSQRSLPSTKKSVLANTTARLPTLRALQADAHSSPGGPLRRWGTLLLPVEVTLRA